MKRLIPAFALLFILITSCGNKKSTSTSTTDPKDTLANTLTLLNEQLKNDPENPNLLFERSKLYYNQKLIQKASEDINKAVSLDSGNALFFLHQSDVYYAMNKIPEARVAIEKSLKINPKSREANTKMGELQFYLRDYANAFKYLDEALKIDPYYAKAYFIKGLCFKENGDTGLAVSSFRTCIEQDPEYFHAYMQLGEIMSQQNNPMAIDYYTNAIRINAGMVEAYYGLAYYYQEHGQPEDAIKVYQDLLNLDSHNAPAKHNIGYIYLFKLNDPGKSINHFNDAILDDQKMVNAYYHRGYAYEKLGKKDLAIKDYKKAVALDPEFELAKNRLKKLGVSI